MSVAYDPEVIRKFAQKLYERAERMVVRSTLLWTVLGFMGGVGLGRAAQAGGNTLLGLVGAAFGGVVGFMWAQERAFALKLSAQQALCQVAIEQNTRVREPLPAASRAA